MSNHLDFRCEVEREDSHQRQPATVKKELPANMESRPGGRETPQSQSRLPRRPSSTGLSFPAFISEGFLAPQACPAPEALGIQPMSVDDLVTPADQGPPKSGREVVQAGFRLPRHRTAERLGGSHRFIVLADKAIATEPSEQLEPMPGGRYPRLDHPLLSYLMFMCENESTRRPRPIFPTDRHHIITVEVPGQRIRFHRQERHLKERPGTRVSTGTTGCSGAGVQAKLDHDPDTPGLFRVKRDRVLERTRVFSAEQVRQQDFFTGNGLTDRDDEAKLVNWPQLVRAGVERYAYLVRGFPLVEEVVFAVLDNYNDAGNCYWRSIATILYGSATFWPRVKADHLALWLAVISDTKHPRHEEYRSYNNRTDPVTIAEGSRTDLEATIHQTFFIPSAWTYPAMARVTADVYGLFVVMFSWNNPDDEPIQGFAQGAGCWKPPVCHGAYNSRHIFILHINENHYQPMTPNDYLGAEFRFPRPTSDTTLGYFGERHVPDERDWAWRCWDDLAFMGQNILLGDHCKPVVNMSCTEPEHVLATACGDCTLFY